MISISDDAIGGTLLHRAYTHFIGQTVLYIWFLIFSGSGPPLLFFFQCENRCRPRIKQNPGGADPMLIFFLIETIHFLVRGPFGNNSMYFQVLHGPQVKNHLQLSNLT